MLFFLFANAKYSSKAHKQFLIAMLIFSNHVTTIACILCHLQLSKQVGHGRIFGNNTFIFEETWKCHPYLYLDV